MNSNIDQIFRFILELDKLKSILRKTKPLGCDRYENAAEHSWHVCLLALLLAKESPTQINVARVVEILLVHDIPEIDAGDHIVYQNQSGERLREERRAAERIFGLLPEAQSSWCLERWQEYETRESDEALFAYAIDRLMPVLQNLNNSGQSWTENNVSLEQVLKVNAAIGSALPTVWAHVETRIKEFGELSSLLISSSETKNDV